MTGEPMVYLNGVRLDSSQFTESLTDDEGHFTVSLNQPELPLKPYDPDYDPALDRLGWDDTDTSPNACAPEVATSRYKASDRSPAAQAWRLNAIRNESWKRQASGTYGAFSDDEMEQARALARSEARPDPVMEILGHPGDWIEGDEPEQWIAAETWEQATVTFTIDTSAITAAAKDLYLNGTGITITDLSSALASPLHDVAKPEPTVNRLRHGTAATCPRHGETRGGTCMRCARGR